MGVMRAPVAGSGCAPACTARVSNAYSAIRPSVVRLRYLVLDTLRMRVVIRPHPELVEGLAAGERTALAESRRLAIVDHAAVDSIPTDFARQPAIFDFWATIHNDGKAGRFRALGCFLVDDTELHP